MQPNPLLPYLTLMLLALGQHFPPAAQSVALPAPGCPGGRFVATVETVQRQNWIENTPTVYDREETALRLPAWLGRLSITHASQGFLLSGEERLGQWTKVTVPPSLTLTMRVFGRHIYRPVWLPVLKQTEACRDDQGNLYVR